MMISFSGPNAQPYVLDGFLDSVKSAWEEPVYAISPHFCIGTFTGTVLATSTHENSVDPRAGMWQEQLEGEIAQGQ